MATREKSVKKYVVRLSADERERLDELIRKGKSSARRLLKARHLAAKASGMFPRPARGGATARSSMLWIPAFRWCTGCASNG